MRDFIKCIRFLPSHLLAKTTKGETQLKTVVPMSQGYPGGWYKVATQKVERGGLLEAELEGANSQGTME